jgi:hypothetical protein
MEIPERLLPTLATVLDTMEKIEKKIECLTLDQELVEMMVQVSGVDGGG